MAFKMKKGGPYKMGTHKTAAYMKSPLEAAKPDYPDIDGDGNTTESMKQAAADKKNASPMKVAGGYYGPSVEDEEGFLGEAEQISKAEFDAYKAEIAANEAEADRLDEIGGTANEAKAAELRGKYTSRGMGPQATGLQGLQEEGINVSSLDDIRAMMEELAPGGVMPDHWSGSQQAAKDPNYALYNKLGKVLSYEQSAKGEEESARQARIDEMSAQ